MLDLKNISQAYGRKTVLADLTHRFSQGVTVITGPSGAGKTTLLRICATAEKPKSGSVTWNDEPVRKVLRNFRSGLGYAPQRIDFPEDISAMDFLLHIAALKNLSRSAAAKQAAGLLERLGLGRDANGRISTYSGGMRRRLGLAQACLGDPKLLIFDEPTAELDPQTAGHIHDLIFELAESSIVLMTTHLADGLSGREISELHIAPAS
ncbi:MAG: ATP-binding cassette domain-containing protein [Litorimonas sp.]